MIYIVGAGYAQFNHRGYTMHRRYVCICMHADVSTAQLTPCNTVMRLCRHFQMMLFLPTCFLCAYIAFAGSAEFDMKAAELVRTAERLEHKVYIID